MSPTKGTNFQRKFHLSEYSPEFSGGKLTFSVFPLGPPTSLVLLLGGNAPRARLGEELPNATP